MAKTRNLIWITGILLIACNVSVIAATMPQLPKPPVTTPQNQAFVLKQVIVEGASLYKNSDLAAFYQPYLGKTVTLTTLQAPTKLIDDQYQKAGYNLSGAAIPEQSVQNGVVHVQITEGYLENIYVQGAGRLTKQALGYANNLKKVRPLTTKVWQRNKQLINLIPGMRVTYHLQHTPNGPRGAYDLTYTATPWRVKPYLDYTNRGTFYLGPARVKMGGYATSFFRSGDQTIGQALFTPFSRELSEFTVIHSTPLGNNGLELNLLGDYSHSNQDFVLSPNDTNGTNTYFNGNLSYPLLLNDTKNLTVLGGFEINNSKSFSFDDQLYADRLRDGLVSAIYAFSDTLFGQSGQNLWSASLTQGFNILSATVTGSPSLSFVNGHSDFTKINFYLSRLQTLPYHFSVLAAGQGQKAFSPLLTAVQFSFGGPDFGRGYDPADIAGDDGIAGKAELRYDMNLTNKYITHLQYFTFYDIGKVWVKDTVIQFPEISASSAGLGVRVLFATKLAGSVEVDKPLTLPDNAYLEEGLYGKNFRIFFNLETTL